MRLCESQQVVTTWHIQTTYTRRLRCFQSNHILNYWLNNITYPVISHTIPATIEHLSLAQLEI